MSIAIQDLKIIKKLRSGHPFGNRAAILGDCTFHFQNNHLYDLFGLEVYKGDMDSVKANTFGNALKFDTVDTFDIFGNPTVRLDLQKTIPDKYHGRYDWIIDAGTMTSCFDFISVWRNVLSMLKEKAIVIHISAMTGYYGRSYHSFQPNLFNDFYVKNNFEILTLGIRHKFFIEQSQTPFTKITNKFLRRLGLGHQENNYLDYYFVKPSMVFLEAVKEGEMIFRKNNSRKQPSTIPNNNVILCAALRTRKTEFSTPTPDFYS